MAKLREDRFGFGGSYRAVHRFFRWQRGQISVQAVWRTELPPRVQCAA